MLLVPTHGVSELETVQVNLPVSLDGGDEVKWGPQVPSGEEGGFFCTHHPPSLELELSITAVSELPFPRTKPFHDGRTAESPQGQGLGCSHSLQSLLLARWQERFLIKVELRFGGFFFFFF